MEKKRIEYVKERYALAAARVGLDLNQFLDFLLTYYLNATDQREADFILLKSEANEKERLWIDGSFESEDQTEP